MDFDKYLYVHKYIYVVCFETNFHNAFNKTMGSIISYDIIPIIQRMEYNKIKLTTSFGL